MSDDLKPCPFCGEQPAAWYSTAERMYFVYCSNPECPARPEIGIAARDADEAKAAWNRRPIDYGRQAHDVSPERKP